MLINHVGETFYAQVESVLQPQNNPFLSIQVSSLYRLIRHSTLRLHT